MSDGICVHSNYVEDCLGCNQRERMHFWKICCSRAEEVQRLNAELAQTRAERDDAWLCSENNKKRYDSECVENEALRARCEALLKALETYGNHDWDCNLYGAVRGSDAHEAGCNCGFDESLAAAAPSGGGGE